jgi:hypothetical protein
MPFPSSKVWYHLIFATLHLPQPARSPLINRGKLLKQAGPLLMGRKVKVLLVAKLKAEVLQRGVRRLRRTQSRDGHGGQLGAHLFILRGQLHLRQGGQALFMRRKPLQARMRTMRVVPAQVVGDVRSGRAHALVGLQVHPFVLDAAP